jgi:hypothetical protein
MHKIANVETDDELHKRIKNIILQDLCSRYQQHDIKITTLVEIQSRIAAVNKDWVNVDLISLFGEDELIEIDDNSDFSLSKKGILYCKSL